MRDYRRGRPSEPTPGGVLVPFSPRKKELAPQGETLRMEGNPSEIWRAGTWGRPYGAISVLGDAMTAAAMKPRLSLRNQTGLLKTP